MPRIRQVKNLASVAALRSHLEGLGVEIPMDEKVDPAGALAQPLAITDGTAGTITAPNRWAVLPMEGWDGEDDGRPSDLVRRRWDRFAASGAGLVWGEATAVRPDGRANPRQLVLDETTVDEFAALRDRLDLSQVTGLQLTHSGRYARPTTAGPAPKTVYEHPLLDARVGSGAAEVLTDEELDELVELFIDRAVLTHQAGFDFVDIKACHGY
ncbi:MAG: NADH:flavin oxidoreductase, partial [Acidimicrobiia bacterium]|nr:NADH:flavin oxidoreductase [Acidimicrobiia bacterium]